MENLTLEELEIISWALDDHAMRILARETSHSYIHHVDGSFETRPNLAYLDTIILKHKVEDELGRRRTGRD